MGEAEPESESKGPLAGCEVERWERVEVRGPGGRWEAVRRHMEASGWGLIDDCGDEGEFRACFERKIDG